MKEKLAFEEMQAAGVDKDVLKLLEAEHPEKEMDLGFDTLVHAIKKGVNPRLLIPLINPDSVEVYLEDMDIASKEWYINQGSIQKKFITHPTVIKEAESHRLRMGVAWSAFAAAGYGLEEGSWNAYQSSLSESIGVFDNATAEEKDTYLAESLSVRNQRINIEASIVADAAVGN